MSDNEDEMNGFSPDENSSGAEEFNPYGQFLEDDDDGSTGGDAGEITTEDDISLPDFLNGGEPAEISDFSEKLASQPPRQESGLDDGKEQYTEEEKTSDESAGTQGASESGAEPEGGAGGSFDGGMPGHEEEGRPENDGGSPDKGMDFSEGKTSEGGDTFDGETDRRFRPKVSASDADRLQGGKPRVLNKKFLLSAVVCILGGIMLVTFLMPGKGSKGKKNAKPVAQSPVQTDYAAIANRHLPKEEEVSPAPEKEEVEIPPVIPDKKPAYTNENINYNTGKVSASSSAVDIPDTRNDPLQGKRISGIKGLSSTQNSYSTDYQQTIAKNTASSAPPSGYSMPSKDEYMKNMLSAYTSAYGNATAGNNSYAVQNDQSGKNSFFNNGRQGDNAGQGQWLNLNTLWQGTIFEATLTSELNTDLPGEITARIAKNIYSSQDGRYLLIPQNSIVYGTYNSSISYSQSRVQVAWHTLVRPDGYQLQLGNMNGTDAKGASGLKGSVNDHPMAYLKAIGLMSVFSIMNTEFASANSGTDNEYVQNVIANSQQVMNELGDKLIDRAMNVQPTIKIKAGTKINIVVNQNLSLPPCEDIPVTQQYRRQR